MYISLSPTLAIMKHGVGVITCDWLKGSGTRRETEYHVRRQYNISLTKYRSIYIPNIHAVRGLVDR